MSHHPPIFSLPLFTLGSVHFPHIMVQLHVFEERYRAMINGCIERGEPFGVVLIREGQEVGAASLPHDVGCVARILAVQRFEDGRMLLFAACEERFRILDYVEAELPYLIGKVELVEDTPANNDELRPAARELAQAFARYLELLAGQTGRELPQVEIPDDPALLAYYVAYVALLPPPAKQRVLALTDPRARLAEVLRLVRRAVVDLGGDPDGPETEGAGGEIGEQASSPSASGVQVVIARPIDTAEAGWRRYQDENRN